jgi:hypothetical protein
MEINWQKKSHITYSICDHNPAKTKGASLYRDDDLGLQMEAHGKKRFYFIDDDKREFKTEAELIEAYKQTPKYLRSQMKVVK